MQTRCEDIDLGALAFQFAPEGLIYSERRVIRRANQAFATMFAMSLDEVEGLSIELLYPSREESERRVAIWGPALHDAGFYADERVMARHGGELFWCAVKGRSLSPQDPFARAVWCFNDLSKQWNLPDLSPREREIAVLLCAGHTAKEIARLLTLSPRTVEAYVAHLKKKLHVRNATELVSRLHSDEVLGRERPL